VIVRYFTLNAFQSASFPLRCQPYIIAPFPDAEILWHQENMADQQKGDNAEYDKERSPDMTFHEIPPSFWRSIMAYIYVMVCRKIHYSDNLAY